MAGESRVRVHNFSISLDGFGVGEGQRLEEPFGHAGSQLLDWALPTRTFQLMGFHGNGPGTVGVDDAFAAQWERGIGVEIMGRNKFGPQRGPWADHEWKGWWGDNPPFHTPCMWDGLEGLEERFTIESISSPSGVVHLTMARLPR